VGVLVWLFYTLMLALYLVWFGRGTVNSRMPSPSLGTPAGRLGYTSCTLCTTGTSASSVWVAASEVAPPKETVLLLDALGLSIAFGRLVGELSTFCNCAFGVDAGEYCLIAGFFMADFGLKNGDVMGGEVAESCISASGDEFGVSFGMGFLVAGTAFDVEVVDAVDGRISSSCISTSGASSDGGCLTAAFPPALERVVGLTVFLATPLDFLVDDLEGGGVFGVDLAVALGAFVTVACVSVIGL